MTDRRRDDLSQFLRSRRARLAPEAAGLPEGVRRRTPGLRREEVAQLAGVGVTWYTWLEQGRPINASVQVLDAIARTLRLDQAERAHLYRLADVPSVPDSREANLAPEVQTVLDALNPLPAAVYNGRFDVLAWNATYGAMYPFLARAEPAERNVLWQLFHLAGCCSTVGNRESELRALVATLRSGFARHPREPAWTSFVERITVASPEFAGIWARHEVGSPASRVKVFTPGHGRPDVRLTTTSLSVTATPDARVVAFVPETERDRLMLAEILSDPPALGLCDYHAAREPEPAREPVQASVPA